MNVKASLSIVTAMSLVATPVSASNYSFKPVVKSQQNMVNFCQALDILRARVCRINPNLAICTAEPPEICQ